MEEYQTKEYWDKRVKESPNRKDMLFLDPRRDDYWRRVAKLLLDYKDKKVLDVCCGFGQFAVIWTPDKYTGVDFSEEMIGLAQRENEGYTFIQHDAKQYEHPNRVDVVFEVNSLHSLGLTPEEFFEKYRDYATEAVLCLEADRFTIFQKYIYDK